MDKKSQILLETFKLLKEDGEGLFKPRKIKGRSEELKKELRKKGDLFAVTKQGEAFVKLYVGMHKLFEKDTEILYDSKIGQISLLLDFITEVAFGKVFSKNELKDYCDNQLPLWTDELWEELVFYKFVTPTTI